MCKIRAIASYDIQVFNVRKICRDEIFEECIFAVDNIHWVGDIGVAGRIIGFEATCVDLEGFEARFLVDVQERRCFGGALEPGRVSFFEGAGCFDASYLNSSWFFERKAPWWRLAEFRLILRHLGSASLQIFSLSSVGSSERQWNSVRRTGLAMCAT